EQQRLSMREGLGLTGVGVGVHGRAFPVPAYAVNDWRRHLCLACKARSVARPAEAEHWTDVRAACGYPISAGPMSCCIAPKCAAMPAADISLPGPGLPRNGQSAQLLGIAAAAVPLISLERLDFSVLLSYRAGNLRC